MADQSGLHPEPERTRRLDEIFADEPYLSPTMRARRLGDTSGVAGSIRDEPGGTPPPLDVERVRPPGTVTLVEMRRKLRKLSLEYGERCTDAEQAQTRRFRDEVLIPWVVRMRTSGVRS